MERGEACLAPTKEEKEEVDARDNPRIKSGDAHDGARTTPSLL
jgi:hypothetical protein